jgi:hypothetical protein
MYIHSPTWRQILCSLPNLRFKNFWGLKACNAVEVHGGFGEMHFTYHQIKKVS